MSSATAKRTDSSIVSPLLELLGIVRVVHIDDIFSGAYPLEDALAAQEILPPATLSELIPDLGEVSEDMDVRRHVFEEHWGSLDSPGQSALGKQIYEEARQSDADIADDPHGAMDLGHVFDSVGYEALSFSEWQQRQQEILAEAGESKTLLLIDNNLSADGGSPDSGMQIIASLAGGGDAESIVLCLLTGAANIDNQDAKWEELADKHNVKRDSFLLIAKDCQFGDIQAFAARLKLALLTKDFAQLKDSAIQVLTEGLEMAKERLQDLSVVDFDHMILRVPYAEGIWEPDVLIRLYSLFHRKASSGLARSQQTIEEVASRLRSVSNIAVEGKSRPSDKVRAIQHQDLYEPAGAINEAHLPLQTGDVFRMTHDESVADDYMLLAQPCDLAVRRANGQRKVSEVTLFKIHKIESKKKLKGLPRSYHHLPYYSEDHGAEFAIDFLTPRSVQALMLDLCVYDREGKCELSVDAPCPDGLLPSWAAHHAGVLAFAQGLLEECNLDGMIGEPDIRRQVLARLAPSVSSCEKFRVRVDGNTIRLPLVRTCRLRIDRAMEVMRQYSAHISRTAFEVDLARDV